MKSVDLNCDVGEGVGLEPTLLPWVSSANIACGAHAGDTATMAATIKLARELDVQVGAHPGFADREHFGRREISLSESGIEYLVTSQLEALAAQGEFSYVKPHGALYNMAARDRAVADAVVRAVRQFDADLWLLGLAGSCLIAAGLAAGLSVAREVFADRGYDEAGRLITRGEPGAMITDEGAAVTQVLAMVSEGRVRSRTGTWVDLQADSVCLHGDQPAAVSFARKLNRALADAGVSIRPFTSRWENTS
ncbi:LamB/YcsF family protein [Synoicihabitans lomoniglobus]|uniref:LamB/YcsF family protein n=1 Tax=Synoicihabitans lomoniglobus TaxID=2909285 RepID=A0AAF0CRG7_9BACT|nr:LamB/YcsF family protein [Opitutaceae bacterium LMO-M01]WED66728.1 LamB/YcsF family protein [Opitutaceae bacterium LMO-M01]